MINFWVGLSVGAGVLSLLIIGWMVYDFIRIEREYSEAIIEREEEE